MPALDFNAICKGSTRKERRSQRRRDYFANKAWLKTFEYKTLILGVNKLSMYVEKLELAQQYHKFILDGIGAHDAASIQILFANLQIYEYIKCELFDSEEDGDHAAAKAAAAMIRHYTRRGLNVLIRYSIEGSTLVMEDKTIKAAIARRVAATTRNTRK
jgi:hypothetical protein